VNFGFLWGRFPLPPGRFADGYHKPAGRRLDGCSARLVTKGGLYSTPRFYTGKRQFWASYKRARPYTALKLTEIRRGRSAGRALYEKWWRGQ